MSNEQQRHDISEKVWNLLEQHLPRQRRQWGEIAQDNRRFINGVFWILRTGAPLKRWRGIATRYAKNTASFLAAVHIRCVAIWCAVLA